MAKIDDVRSGRGPAEPFKRVAADSMWVEKKPSRIMRDWQWKVTGRYYVQLQNKKALPVVRATSFHICSSGWTVQRNGFAHLGPFARNRHLSG